MLVAKSIAFGHPAGGGPLGIYTAGLMQRLGLAADLKAKAKLFPSGTPVAEAMARGECEIGIGLASDAVVVPGLVSSRCLPKSRATQRLRWGSLPAANKSMRPRH